MDGSTLRQLWGQSAASPTLPPKTKFETALISGLKLGEGIYLFFAQEEPAKPKRYANNWAYFCELGDHAQNFKAKAEP
jgi:hypothetical protein